MYINTDSDYMERIAYLAYFFVQTHVAQGGDGHSELIKLVNPAPGKANFAALRSIVLHGFVRQKKFDIAETAIAAAKWLRSSGFAPNVIVNEDDQLKKICNRYESPIDFPHSVRNIRACLQLVRLLWLMHAHSVSAHSRVIEYFFPNNKILIGRSPNAPIHGSHPEHVVPCAYIRDEVFKRFRARSLVVDGNEDALYALELCHFVDRLLAVAYISKEEAGYLDAGKNALRSTMPMGWDPDDGDILARLKQIPGYESLLPI